jgi:hypothetical protein
LEISKSSHDSFYLNIIMNFVIIILGVALVISLYVLFVFFYKSKSVVEKVDLSSGSKTVEAELMMARGTRCAYGAWIYVNAWNNNSEKLLLTRGNKFELFLDRNTPTLKCRLNTGDAQNAETVTLTSNFPIQKWVYVIVSLDNQILDCYLDGKLVVSKQLKASVTNDGSLVLGKANAGDIFMAKVRGWEVPMDPQTAWSSYLDGNGMSTKTTLPNYNVQMSILEDNVEKTQFKLF